VERYKEKYTKEIKKIEAGDWTPGIARILYDSNLNELISDKLFA